MAMSSEISVQHFRKCAEDLHQCIRGCFNSSLVDFAASEIFLYCTWKSHLSPAPATRGTFWTGIVFVVAPSGLAACLNAISSCQNSEVKTPSKGI